MVDMRGNLCYIVPASIGNEWNLDRTYEDVRSPVHNGLDRTASEGRARRLHTKSRIRARSERTEQCTVHEVTIKGWYGQPMENRPAFRNMS